MASIETPAIEAMSKKILTINSVAKKSGLGIETIRYYQRIGLVEKPEKPKSGYRIYSEDIIARLLFIQRAKGLGFSLTEIATLMALGDGRCDETKELAVHKLEVIKTKLHDLQAMANTLEKLIESCESNSTHPGCPIISVISER
ncbi:MAG: MerR family transcriptional regulator [Methylococcales bacterium]